MFGSGFRRKIAELEREWAAAPLERRRTLAEKLQALCGEHHGRRDAVPFAEQLLRDQDAQIGEAATYAISHGGSTAFARLRQLLDDPDALVRERACHALGNFDEAAAPALHGLLAALADPSAGVRGGAAYALGRIPDTSRTTVDALARLARDPEPVPRRLALHALGRIGREGGAAAVRAHRDLFLAAIADSDAEVRRSACYAFQTTDPRGTRAIPILLECLDRETATSTRRELAGTLFWAARDADLSPYLPRMLEMARDNREARPTIFSLCSHLGARAAALLPLIHESLTGEDAQSAIGALRAIGGDGAQVITALETVLDTGGFQQRFWAAGELLALTDRAERIIPMLEWALTQSPDEPGMFIQEVGSRLAAIAPALARAMEENFDEPDWDVMWNLTCAMSALESVEPVAIVALCKSLAHESGRVQGAALSGLAKAGPAARAALPGLRALAGRMSGKSRGYVLETIRAIERPTN